MGLFNCRRVGELEADTDRLRRKMLRERAQKEQLARGIEDAQRQMAFEKETAQAVEAALIKKSKDLEEYVMISSWFTALMIPCPFREVAEYEAVVERMRTELDVYKDRNRRSVLQQPSDERGRNSSCKQSLFLFFNSLIVLKLLRFWLELPPRLRVLLLLRPHFRRGRPTDHRPPVQAMMMRKMTPYVAMKKKS